VYLLLRVIILCMRINRISVRAKLRDFTYYLFSKLDLQVINHLGNGFLGKTVAGENLLVTDANIVSNLLTVT
jgi:hypothetical protein